MDSDTLRILDVNLNRAREALRVIEDHARFALDDADAAARAKTLRHDLRRLRELLGPPELLAARAIESDVGRDAKTPAELDRASPADVLTAALARLAEAARSLGEYAKLTSPDAAALAERIRYEAYALEPLLATRSTLRARLRRARLHVLLTESLCRRDWLDTATACLAAGAGCIQLREKHLPDGQLLGRARTLRRLTREHNALLIINDRPDIARLAAADGVHVGQTDLPVAEARRIAGGQRLIGKSTHDARQWHAATAEQPDYVAIGPMYASPTKPDVPVAGPRRLRELAGTTDLPIIAIGGIQPPHAATLIASGATAVAVCSAIIAAPDPAAATRRFIEALAAC